MAWQDTYRDLAVEINNCIEDRPNGLQYSRDAIFILVNLASSGENTPAVTSLFYDVYGFYSHVYQGVNYDGHAKKLVSKINSFTVKNYGGDLTTFVNSISWDNNCVPYYWAIYSEEDGYDISEWDVCS